MKQKKYLVIRNCPCRRHVYVFLSLRGILSRFILKLVQEGVTVEELQSLLENAPGVVVQDDPSKQLYPMPLFAEGKDEVFVGRIRKDPEHPAGFHLWIVSDNLLKGAALNSVQIAETST